MTQLSKIAIAITFVGLYHTSLLAQVDEIKSASRSSGRGGDQSSGGSSFAADFVFNFMVGNMVQWQRNTLSKRSEIPDLISVDATLQAAAQPSSYYIIHPRIRGTWGIFSSDFRMNYILEEDVDGMKLLRTTDWQVIQLNIVAERGFSAWMGVGYLQEDFGDRHAFGEWTTGIHIKPFEKKLQGVFEYRRASSRTEINGHVRYPIGSASRVRLYTTGGFVYQRYYNTVSVWGFQGGIGLRVF